MHQTQKVILKRLVQQNDQKYSELTRGFNFENNIVFHLNQLIESQYLEKSENIYSITPLGIKEIYKYKLSDLSEPGIKTFFCGFIISDGSNNFLLKSHPTAKVNFYNFPSGRPLFGEPMEQALARLFKDNTGIEIKPNRFKYVTLHAKIVKTPSGEPLFDDGQAMYQVEVSESEKTAMKLLDGVIWLNSAEIKRLGHKWPEIDMLLLEPNPITYASYDIISNYKL